MWDFLSFFHLVLPCLLAERGLRSSLYNILFNTFPYFPIVLQKHQVCLVHVEILGMSYHKEKLHQDFALEVFV